MIQIPTKSILLFDVLIFTSLILLILTIIPTISIPNPFSMFNSRHRWKRQAASDSYSHPRPQCRRVHRMKTWFGLIISSIILCISYILLLGHQVVGNSSGREEGRMGRNWMWKGKAMDFDAAENHGPSFALCLVSAGTIYASPVLVSVSGVLFVTELYMRLSAKINFREVREDSVSRMIWALPAAFATIFIEAVTSGLLDKESVQIQPFGFFCHITKPVPTTINTILVILCLLTILTIEGYIITLLFYKQSFVKLTLPFHIPWFKCPRSQERPRRTSAVEGVEDIAARIGQERLEEGGNSLRNDFPVNMFIRMFLYSLLAIGMIPVDILIGLQARASLPGDNDSQHFGDWAPDGIKHTSREVTQTFLAAIPLTIALVFGTQMDILRFYINIFRRPSPSCSSHRGLAFGNRRSTDSYTEPGSRRFRFRSEGGRFQKDIESTRAGRLRNDFISFSDNPDEDGQDGQNKIEVMVIGRLHSESVESDSVSLSLPRTPEPAFIVH